MSSVVTKGRIVFVAGTRHGRREEYPAIVTRVYPTSPTIDCVVFDPALNVAGSCGQTDVAYNPTGHDLNLEGPTWRWPPRD